MKVIAMKYEKLEATHTVATSNSDKTLRTKLTKNRMCKPGGGYLSIGENEAEGLLAIWLLAITHTLGSVNMRVSLLLLACAVGVIPVYSLLGLLRAFVN
jgi:hypothetical protein